MGRQQQGVTSDTIDAWKTLVTISRGITQSHPAKAKAYSIDDMTAMTDEIIAGTFTTENIKERIMALQHAFPSSPHRNPLVGFSFRYEDTDRFYHHTFAALYSAKHFIEQVLDGLKYKWVSDNEIEVQEPFFCWIKCDGTKVGFEDVLEHKFTKEEAEWELPAPYSTYVRQCRRTASSEHQVVKSHQADEQPAQIVKPAREKAPRKPAKAPKPSAEGLITIGDVAAEYGFDAKQARGIMRSAKIDKPDHGRWEWTTVPKEVHQAFKNFKK